MIRNLWKNKTINFINIAGLAIGMAAAMLILKWVLVSLFISCPIAWWAMNKWLEGFAYRIGSAWWMFVLAGSVAVIISVLTIAVQAIRSAVTNPDESLRNP